MTSQDSSSFPTFPGFIRSVTSAQHQEYAQRPAAKVADASQFEVMREYIIDRYDGVEVAHSFVDENGQVFDCIPIEQQPSLKGSSARPSAAPTPPGPPPGMGGSAPGEVLHAEPQLRPGRIDEFGHAMHCPPGTIAMRRVTLDELTKNEKLRDFFRKAPDGEERLPGPGRTIDAPAPNIRYAFATQAVDNVGGTSTINRWKPNVGSSVGFSLSQQWFAGGQGGTPAYQSIESGWQVYPAKYGTQDPVLFIYWTPDNYQTGGYNLDVPGFVQTDSTWMLGGTLSQVSTPGGTQYADTLRWSLLAGPNVLPGQAEWWFTFNGTLVGYYPASRFGGGQLASNATEILFGGEVSIQDPPWPQMGSGAFANAGQGYAAFQSDIGYFPPGVDEVRYPALAGFASKPCYSSTVVNPGSSNVHMYFGGPGGESC